MIKDKAEYGAVILFNNKSQVPQLDLKFSGKELKLFMEQIQAPSSKRPYYTHIGQDGGVSAVLSFDMRNVTLITAREMTNVITPPLKIVIPNSN